MFINAVLSCIIAAVPMQGVSKIVQRVAPAIVDIDAVQDVRPFSDDPFFGPLFGEMIDSGTMPSSGTGVIVAANGMVVTCEHIIGNARTIKVRLNNRKEFDASVVYRDSSHDLAILKIQANQQFPFIKLSNSDEVFMGDFTVAIGNNFGAGQSVAGGIVSMPSRIFNKKVFIQTDIESHPGNSGGALINIKGELIGISNARYSKSGAAYSTGFYIPSNLINAIYGESRGRKPGYFGLSVSGVSHKLRSQGLHHGVYVSTIERSGNFPVQAGDIITKINGYAVNTPEEFTYRERLFNAGQKVNLRVYRIDKYLTIPVQLLQNMNLDNQDPSSLIVSPEKSIFLNESQPLNRTEIQETSEGIVIKNPHRDVDLILKTGDVIKKIQGQEVQNSKELEQALSDFRTHDSLTLSIKRSQETLDHTIQRFPRKNLFSKGVFAEQTNKETKRSEVIVLLEPSSVHFLKRGDVITSLDGRSVHTVRDLETRNNLGEKDIEIEFKRDSKIFSKIFSNNKSASQKDNSSQERRGLSLNIFS